MPTKKHKTKTEDLDALPLVFETFRRPGHYERYALRLDEPTSLNGIIRIRKYRITFEEVEEPTEVLTERLERLWQHADNHHHHDPLMHEARRLGYLFKGKFGAKVKKP